MWNCVLVSINNRPRAYFHTIVEAEAYRNLMLQTYPHLNMVITCDWKYVPDLAF